MDVVHDVRLIMNVINDKNIGTCWYVLGGSQQVFCPFT